MAQKTIGEWVVVKTLTGYAEHARFRSLHLTAADAPVAWVPRHEVPVSTPYRSGPSMAVVQTEDGRAVVLAEVGHRRVLVLAVPRSVATYTTDDEASEVYIEHVRAARDSRVA